MYFAASVEAAVTVAWISPRSFSAGSFCPAHAARRTATRNTKLRRPMRLLRSMGDILAQFPARTIQPFGLRPAIVGRTQFGAIQQVLQHALRLLKLAAFLEQQSVAQARLGARISRCNACVFAFSLVQRVPGLESPGIQKLRVGGFEIRILLGEQFQR